MNRQFLFNEEVNKIFNKHNFNRKNKKSFNEVINYIMHFKNKDLFSENDFKHLIALSCSLYIMNKFDEILTNYNISDRLTHTIEKMQEKII